MSHIGTSGGIKVVLQHLTLLREMGYEAVLLTRKIEGKLDVYGEWVEALMISRSDPLDDVPECDLFVGTTIRDVEYLFQHRRGKVVHLCQGYEPIKYMGKIKKEFMPEKYSNGRSIFSILRRYLDMMKSKRKIKKIESIYALPTVKAAVSRYLVDLIEKRYGQRCHLIQNGIDHRIFYPAEKRIWGENGNIKMLSVGSMHVGFKGIEDTLMAIKMLKQRGIPVKLIRASYTPPSRKELDGNLVDRFHIGLSEKEMANLYRDTDIFISSSLEVEGFGLPAMEALASGVPSILTEISSYKHFDEERNFAYFVPTHRPDKMVEGVLALIENEGLREKCIKKGLEVARQYSLKITQEHLLNFIREMV